MLSLNRCEFFPCALKMLIYVCLGLPQVLVICRCTGYSWQMFNIVLEQCLDFWNSFKTPMFGFMVFEILLFIVKFRIISSRYWNCFVLPATVSKHNAGRWSQCTSRNLAIQKCSIFSHPIAFWNVNVSKLVKKIYEQFKSPMSIDYLGSVSKTNISGAYSDNVSWKTSCKKWRPTSLWFAVCISFLGVLVFHINEALLTYAPANTSCASCYLMWFFFFSIHL